MAAREPMSTDEEVDDPPTGPSDVVVMVEDELVDGRYRVVRELGRGGMSVVYLAEHVDLHRPVALKILRPPRRSAGLVDFQAWFRREARTLAAIQHANVVALYDFGKLGPEAFFLAMEYLDGPSLAKLLKGGPLEPHRAIKLLAQACRALRHTHSRGVVHRDIKPSNLIVTKAQDGHEVVKVIDFGIADAGGEPDDDDVLVGSPHCMAPEQIERKAVGPSADLYSLGVVLFRAVSGKWPFTGSNRRETLLAHLTREPPSLQHYVPDLDPPELDEVVRRCLARDPADRYPDAGALLDDLLLLLGDEQSAFDTATMVAPTIETLPPLVEETRRFPAWTVIAAGAALVVAGGLWAVSGTGDDEAVVASEGAATEAPVEPVTAPDEPPSTAPPPSSAPVEPPSAAPRAASPGGSADDEPKRAAQPERTSSPTKRTSHTSHPREERSPAPSKDTPGGQQAPQGYKEMPEF
jgi:serine/threonine protein kinase